MTPPAHRTRARALVPALVVLGIALRLAHYFDNRSLWSDEAALAANVISRSFAALTEPLANDQAAPYGFLALTKALVLGFGSSEYVLRLVPLLAGIGALLLFVRLARTLLDERAATLAIAFFALVRPLVRYSVEVKPYSLDVFVAVGLLLVFLAAKRALDEQRFAPRFAVGLGMAGALAVWSSYPSVFLLAAAALTMFGHALARGDARRLRPLVLPAVLWGASFAVAYVVCLRDAAASEYLHSFWANDPPQVGAPELGAFLPFPPTSASDVRWYPLTLLGMFADPLGLQLRGLAAFAFVAGCLRFRRERATLAFLTVPALLALLASAFELYPFYGRLLLYAAPGLLLLVAEGAHAIVAACETSFRARGSGRAGRNGARVLGASLVALMLLNPVLSAVGNLASPEPRKEMREVLTEVARDPRGADALYVYHSAQLQFDYYGPRIGLDPNWVVAGVRSVGDWEPYRADVARLAERGRVWFVFSHELPGEYEFFRSSLNASGEEIGRVERVGARALLFEF